MDQNDFKFPAFSTKYSYGNVVLERYGEYELLPPKRTIYMAQLKCEGDTDDSEQPVFVYVDDKKVGELPHNRLQTMWHDFIKRGDRVSALVEIRNGEYTLSLNYCIPSKKVYEDLDYRGHVKIEHTFYDCDLEELRPAETFAELHIDEDEEEYEFYNISYLAYNIGRFPEKVAKLVEDVTDCRVFLKEIEPFGDGRAKAVVHIFLDAPVEQQISNRHRDAQAKPAAPPIPQTYHKVYVSFEGSAKFRKAVLKMNIDEGEERSVKNGDTDTFMLLEGNHFIKFSCEGYCPQGLNFDLKQDADISVSLKFWTNSIDVNLRKQYS